MRLKGTQQAGKENVTGARARPRALAHVHKPEPQDMAASLLTLQRTHGNRFVRQMIQTKLPVGQPGDRYEQEAEQVAERVAHASDVGAGNLRRQPMETLRAPEVSPDVESRVHAMRGSGQPLPESARGFFEPRFGHDFSDVRVHTDAQAADVARQLGARAYTVGTDVGFGTGQYAPNTRAGRRLLAHELTHVVQQGHSANLRLQCARLTDFIDKDPLHDPSKLTDAQIEATDEFKEYMDPKSVWQKTHKMTKEEALLACRLMLRYMRGGDPRVWFVDLGGYSMDAARKQLGTLKKTEAAVGSLEWKGLSHKAAVEVEKGKPPSTIESDFERWMLAGGPEPDATTGKVNCFEMVLFSAYKGGFTSKKRITDIYNEGFKKWKATKGSVGIGDVLEAELRTGNEYVLNPADPKSPEPLPGDIVIFTRAKNHAAISRGTKDGTGRHKIISLWTRPGGKSDRVEETTIEELLPSLPGSTVKFWSPGW